jgi:glycosyltransferase involved in cell wall biosynthesis
VNISKSFKKGSLIVVDGGYSELLSSLKTTLHHFDQPDGRSVRMLLILNRQHQHSSIDIVRDLLGVKDVEVVCREVSEFLAHPNLESGFDICTILSEDNSEVRSALNGFTDYPMTILISKDQSWIENHGVYVVSIPKSGTHLLFGLLEAMGIDADSSLQSKQVELPPARKWISAFYRHQHLSAIDFFRALEGAPFGGVNHPLFQSPVFFMYRNPRDILVSESHYYQNPRNTALGNYYSHFSQEECVLSMLSDDVPIDNFSYRMASYTPWFQLANVIPISFEELVGPRGGGDEIERLGLIWSIQLKLGATGNLSDISHKLSTLRNSSRTLRNGNIGEHKQVFSKEIWNILLKKEPLYMYKFGYEVNVDDVMSPLPLHRMKYRARLLELGDVTLGSMVSEPVLIGCHERWNLVEYLDDFYAVALSAGFVDFFDNRRLTSLLQTGELVCCDTYDGLVQSLEKNTRLSFERNIMERVEAIENKKSLPEEIKISLLLPTRGRPQLVERFLKSVLDCSDEHEKVEIILYIDEDDVESHHLSSNQLNLKKIIGPRGSMGYYNMACLEIASGEIIVLANDDMVIRTHSWDLKLRTLHTQYSDGIYLAYGNDLFKGGDLCTFPILSKRTCELLKEPYPRVYQGAFIDYHLFDIFQRLKFVGLNRIVYLKDVVFEHLHFRAGKAVQDATYMQRNRFADDHIFVRLDKLRYFQALKLENVINGFSDKVESQAFTFESKIESLSIAEVTMTFLLNKFLPVRWRFFLWYWFVGRLLAARGYLKPFVK